jgi:hypothetical protein
MQAQAATTLRPELIPVIPAIPAIPVVDPVISHSKTLPL